MESKELLNDYVFMGYDVRQTNNNRIKWINKNRIISVDKVICPRLNAIKDFDWEKVGTKLTEWGMCLSYQVAYEYYKYIPNKEYFEILAFFLSCSDFENGKSKGILVDSNALKLNDEIGKLKKFEGFDIGTIEYEWISYLTNCGRENEVSIKTKVNNVNLLSDYGNALKIKKLAEKDIPEHQPWAIWSVWSTYS